MLFTDLQEVKTLLEIDPDNTAEDKKLNFLIEIATQWIGEVVNRRDFERKSRTEFYNGSGTQKLVLRNTPVHDITSVFLDEMGFFGTPSDAFDDDALTEGDDYALDIKEEGQPSLTGIVWRINNIWPRPNVRQRGYLSPFIGPSIGNLKITYDAGYTVDDLPAPFRLAAITLLSQLRYLFPLGVGLNSESYEDRSISVVNEKKDYILGMVKPMLWPYRRWKFGSR